MAKSKKYNNKSQGCDSKDEMANEKYTGKGSNSRRNGNSYKGTNDRSNSNKFHKVSEHDHQSNDPMWYMSLKDLVVPATRVSFATQVGAKIPNLLVSSVNNTPNEGVFINSTTGESVPGIAVLHMINSPGIATSSTSGVNIAASALFTSIRKDLATTAPYAAADVLAYALGLDSIYSYYAHLVRLFGTLNVYSGYNLFTPRTFLSAVYGMSSEAIDDFLNNQANYRSKFNSLIYKASKIYYPYDFSITKRHTWLYTNYWFDAPNLKAQVYAYKPDFVYILDETYSEQGTALRPVPVPTTVSEMLNLFNEMIEVYRNSDSMLKIQADMERAFGGRLSSWALETIPEIYAVVPAYSQDALEQLTNTEILPLNDIIHQAFQNYASNDNYKTIYNSFCITQSVSKNIMLYQPTIPPYESTDPDTTGSLEYFNDYKQLLFNNKLLNLITGDSSPERIVEITRCKPTWTVDNSGNAVMTGCGADICIGGSIYTLSGDNSNRTTLAYPVRSNLIGGFLDEDGVKKYVTSAKQFTLINAFDWFPTMFTATPNEEDDSKFELLISTDISNYAVADNNMMEQLHSVVNTSVWDVPAWGNSKYSGKV
nr:putative capsid [Marmot picobirnavirus]